METKLTLKCTSLRVEFSAVINSFLFILYAEHEDEGKTTRGSGAEVKFKLNATRMDHLQVEFFDGALSSVELNDPERGNVLTRYCAPETFLSFVSYLSRGVVKYENEL